MLRFANPETSKMTLRVLLSQTRGPKTKLQYKIALLSLPWYPGPKGRLILSFLGPEKRAMFPRWTQAKLQFELVGPQKRAI